MVVSIYVNPTQFTAAADLAAYPRTLDADAALAEASGADLLFHPSDAEIYPPDEAVPTIDPGPLALRLEGAARPGHFAGVATVVSRLFDLVQPDRAYFGEKDAQQLRVVEWTTARRTSAPRISIRRVPTVRDADGLALSSRNARLSPPAERRPPRSRAHSTRRTTRSHTAHPPFRRFAQRRCTYSVNTQSSRWNTLTLLIRSRLRHYQRAQPSTKRFSRLRWRSMACAFLTSVFSVSEARASALGRVAPPQGCGRYPVSPQRAP